MKIFRLIAACAAVSVCASAPALTNYTVNKAGTGSPNFTELSACLAAVNAGLDTDYNIQFTDTATVQYDLSPAEITIRDGVKLVFAPDVEGVVTVNGRMNVAQGGGTMTATGVSFINSGQWALFHGYDGQTYTRCNFGPAADNGLIFRGATNTLTSCTFNSITNSAIIASGGITNVNGGTWTDCGRVGVAGYGGDTNPSNGLFINGGTATKNQFGPAFVCSGFRLTVNNFTSTGYNSVLCHDWETGADGGLGWLTANNCTFTNVADRMIAYYQNVPNSANKDTTITANNCLFENRAASGADLCVIDARNIGNNGTVILNGCILRGLNTANVASGLVCWQGGLIMANNTVIDGTANPVLATSENSGFDAAIKLNHCVVANGKTQAAICSDMANTILWVRNSIIDASNAVGINAAGTNNQKLVDYNLINSSGNYDGTNVSTGNPMYVDPPNGNWRTGLGSAAHGKGTPTDLLYDVDGNAYDATAPDCGINQVTTTAVPDWAIYN
ncbi:MAG: hypothetical protein NTY46_08690 [Candidatus Sumerlaeota bacterium]|nr:hypothetical protein [Candidatus Sumerlaeota bacterium]